LTSKGVIRLRGSLEAQREIHSLSGSQPSVPFGRETYPKIFRRVSWVDMVRHEVYMHEDSRIKVSSREVSCQSIGFSSVTQDATRQEDRRVLFSSMIEGESNHMDWRVFFIEDQIQETKLLLVDDGGWNSSLTKRKFVCFGRIGHNSYLWSVVRIPSLLRESVDLYILR
jgi:hypothetical protein